VAKLDRIEKETIFFSGVDLVDRTPIIDLKPYIPCYDAIPGAFTPLWIDSERSVSVIRVEIAASAESELQMLLPKLHFFESFEDIRAAIIEVLTLDPRSIFWRESCSDRRYGFCIDCLNICCEFSPMDTNLNTSGNCNGESDLRRNKGNQYFVAHVVEIQDWSHKYYQEFQVKKLESLHSTTTQQETSSY